MIPISKVEQLINKHVSLEKELLEVDSNINRLQNLLKSENFENKAPEEVVESEQERLSQSQERKYQLEEIIKSIT